MSGARGLGWHLDADGVPALLLHGFTGGPASWRAVAEALDPPRPLFAPPLPGHCGAAIDPDAPFAAIAETLLAAPSRLGWETFEIVGYSLGARVALSLLVEHPRGIAGACLIGVRPGLARPAERARRREQDAERARALRRDGLDAFLEAWEREPLFETQARLPAPTLDEQRRIRRSHDAEALAASLEGLGLAAMPNYTPRLGVIAVPTTLVVGEHDVRFAEVARGMISSIVGGRLVVVDGAGHNVVLERPDAVADLLSRRFPR
jgi:2-succinyl-6-hydroxy-2,4-cyclohexadiene-1-carboxylate synthase